LLQLAGPGDLGAADAGGAGLDGRPAGGALGAQRARPLPAGDAAAPRGARHALLRGHLRGAVPGGAG
ncbi:unnamed protein product, partial [Effrenium voratum]